MFGKKQNKAEKPPALYSEAVSDPRIKNAVLALADGGHDRFRTGAFTWSGAMQLWLEAVKDRQTGLWTVNRHERMGPTLHRQKPVMTAVRFFDALHYCGRFESGEEYAVRDETAEDKDIAHYRDAAEAADIPLDRDGLPHPAVNGEILTGETTDFDDHAYEVAKRTINVALPTPVPAAVEMCALEKALTGIEKLPSDAKTPPGANPEEKKEEQPAKKKKHVKRTDRLADKFQYALEAAEDLNLITGMAVQEEFGNVTNYVDGYVAKGTPMLAAATTSGVAGAVLTQAASIGAFIAAGGLPLVLMAGGLTLAIGGIGMVARGLVIDDSDHQFSIRDNKLRKAIGKLPEGADKSRLQEFEKAARSVFNLEKAVHYSVLRKNGKKGPSEMQIHKLVMEAARIAGSSDADSRRLADAYKEGLYGEAASFWCDLDDDFKALKTRLGQTIDRLEAGGADLEPPAIGDEMEDGTIYAGISPDTGKAMYATPRDASGVYDFNEAAKYASKLDAHGHKDWRLPTKNELNVLYQNRDKGKLKGTFNETGSYPAGWYWSSSQTYYNGAWAQRFSDGVQHSNGRYGGSSLRCVR
ncbi:MAG TPA: DUF1566 domain-containing protein [Terriglobia bacterium]|nr:DUF1566 domain-containing protein [Terriglobia bacterium]